MIYNQDCLEAMKDMSDNQFDLAIVDPPYGIGFGEYNRTNKDSNGNRYKANKYKQGNWDDSIPTDDYFVELQRVSKNQIVWGYNYMADKLPPCKGFIYWNKLNHHDNRSDGELAYTSFNKLARHFEYMWDGNRYGFIGAIQGVGKKSIRTHPTQKPIALYEWLLMNYAKEGDTILDTHLGSGSIAIACHNLGYDLTGYEIDKEYFEAAIKRIEQHKAQKRLF